MTAPSSPRPPGLAPFHAMEVFARARRLEAEGRSICHLEVGEPGSPPAPEVLAAAAAALGEPQRYTHAKGRLDLRQAIAADYRRRYGVEVDPEAIIVTMGSSAALIIAFLAALEPGARIAITRPGYPGSRNSILGLGFGLEEIPVAAANGWRLTAADIVAAHRQRPFEALLLASPANPTGAAVPGEALKEIAETCTRLGIRLISDEIYHGLEFSGRSSSALEGGEDAVVINSFSKYYCMTGWRIGWAILPAALLRKAETLQQNLFISASSLSQTAALAALGAQQHAEAQKALYLANRDLLIAGLNRLGLTTAGQGDGAFYAYADASRFTNDSLGFAMELVDRAGLAAAPGIDFDTVEGQRYLRFSYAGRREVIEEGLGRLELYLGGRA